MPTYVGNQDLFEFGCDCCGYRTTGIDIIWPSDSTLFSTVERGCKCE